MITYDINLCIGIDSQGKNVVVKCHDTGVNLRVWLSVLHQKTWRAETEPYIIPDESITVLKIAKPDKTYVLVDGEITGGHIFFELPPQAFTAAGVSKAEVSLFDNNGRRLTTASFEIEVPEECVCDCKEESKTYVDIMAEQIQAAIDAEANAKTYAERAEDAAALAGADADVVQKAIDTALQEAKDSGEFDGKDADVTAFTIALSASKWSDKVQTVSDDRFLTSGYVYSVTPDPGSFVAYAEAVVYADNITADGQIVFHCGELPAADLKVNILRTGVCQ